MTAVSVSGWTNFPSLAPTPNGRSSRQQDAWSCELGSSKAQKSFQLGCLYHWQIEIVVGASFGHSCHQSLKTQCEEGLTFIVLVREEELRFDWFNSGLSAAEDSLKDLNAQLELSICESRLSRAYWVLTGKWKAPQGSTRQRWFPFLV